MRIGFVLIVLVFMGCAAHQADTPSLLRADTQIKAMIADKDLEVFVTSANPLSNQDIARIGLLPAGSTANRILLNGDDYFKVKGDSISVQLPYYGTQQLPAEYLKGLGGFQYQGPYKSYQYEYNEKKKVHNLKLKVQSERESLTIWLKLYRTKKADLYINSSHRTAINYDGQLKMGE